MKYTQQEQEMMQKMLLSPHFTLGEFIRSGTAIRRSIDNVPPDIIFIIRMMLLCENILEPLRKRFGAIPISSGYRCHLLNLAVGGAFGSQHELGEAADIPVASKEKMKQYVDFITENCHFHICAFLQKFQHMLHISGKTIAVSFSLEIRQTHPMVRSQPDHATNLRSFLESP